MIMKVIIVLFSVFLFVGCYENKEPSNECFFLDEAKKCWFKTENRYCLYRAFHYMTVIGTRYEYLLDRVAHGELTAYFEKEEKEEEEEEKESTINNIRLKGSSINNIRLFDIISKADKENLIFNFYENHNALFVKDDSDPRLLLTTDTLIKFRKHYNCPAPKI